MIWVRFLDELELQMTAFGTHLSSHSIVIDIFGEEDRSGIAGTERLELL